MAALTPVLARAQVLERHAAPGAVTPSAPVLAAPPAAVVDDDRVLAPALRGLVLIGPGGDPAAWPARAAIEDQGVDAPDTPALLVKLRPYLGQPLTLKLISRIQAAVTRHYRALDRPFVAVAAPPQDITQGVLRLRVIAFHLGAKTVKAGTAAQRAAIAGAIRVQPGQPISAAQLSQDLEWLGHSPFELVQAAFSPGASAGATDLTVTRAPVRPWSVFAGYDNNGAPSSGLDRYDLGARAAIPGLQGGLVAYQMTGSGDAFSRGGAVLPLGGAQYASQSLTAVAPLAPRQDLTLNLDYITSRQPVQAFDLRQATTLADLTWRFALSNLLPTLGGDVSLGVEMRRQQARLIFGSTPAASHAFDVGQVMAAYSLAWSSGGLDQTVFLAVHDSPGGLDANNRSAALALASNGRVSRSAYAYADLTYSVHAPLFLGFSYQGLLTAQAASAALPDTESAALGGVGAVRGYTYDDGGYDQALVLRNELRRPLLMGGLVAAAPFAFADVGQARDVDHGAHDGAVSAGLGADAQFSSHLSGNLTAAVALTDAPRTRAGDERILATLSFRN